MSMGRAVFLPDSRLGGHVMAWSVAAKAQGLRPFGGGTCSCPHLARSSVLSLLLEPLAVTGEVPRVQTSSCIKLHPRGCLT